MNYSTANSKAVIVFSGCHGLLLAVLGAAMPCFPLDNGVARTPPMGWSTFNQFGGVWGEPILKEVADSLVATGLADCGYQYVNCDGHNTAWSAFPGSGWPQAENLSAGWAKKCADYIHGKGLKFGVYMTSTENPQASAQDLVDAEVDFLKHDDWGGKPDDFWASVRDALLASGRPIVYSTNNIRNPAYCNMARTGGDIKAEWDVIMGDFNSNIFFLPTAQPGYWPDADMLEVGCNTYTGGQLVHILTPEEDRAHFSMWCMMASPLIVGYNFTRKYATDYMQNNYTLDETKFPMENHINTVAILSNIEVIALNQDTIGLAGERFKVQGDMEIWLKNCADGTKAVALFNRSGSSADMSISQQELGWGTSPQIYIRDLWLHENLEPFTGSFTKNVASHAAEIYRMGTSPIEPVYADLRKMDRAVAWLKRNGRDVFPQRMIPSVIAGTDARARAYDTRGRELRLDPHLAAPGMLLLKTIAGENYSARAVWMAH